MWFHGRWNQADRLVFPPSLPPGWVDAVQTDLLPFISRLPKKGNFHVLSIVQVTCSPWPSSYFPVWSKYGNSHIDRTLGNQAILGYLHQERPGSTCLHLSWGLIYIHTVFHPSGFNNVSCIDQLPPSQWAKDDQRPGFGRRTRWPCLM